MQTIKTSTIYNCDCMELMKQYPDNYFDLAIVDPPYGIGAGSIKFKNGNSKSKKLHFKENDWDEKPPSKKYFDELKRISKNQIIWGGNYFIDHLTATRCMIFWDKTIHGQSYADGELAWTSFDKNVRYFRENIAQTNVEGRIHPTQKSIKLYEWLLTNYAKQGDKILDTHLGSGSHAIACNNMGFELTACELDKDYYEASIERIKREAQQERLF